jgi:hypothetical protein
MPTETKQPPTLPGVTWSDQLLPGGYGCRARINGRPSKLFWEYYKDHKHLLHDAGVYVTYGLGPRFEPENARNELPATTDGDVTAWEALRDSAGDAADVRTYIFVAVREAVAFGPHPLMTPFCKRAVADIDSVRRMRTEDAERRAELKEPISAEERADLLRRVREAQARYGVPLVGVKLDLEDPGVTITRGSADWITSNLKRLATMDRDLMREAARVGFEGFGVSWPDDVVERSVVRLTTSDLDRAIVQNRIGWSKIDCARGHWCAAAIRRPEARASGIALARTLLGKYARTQLADILIGAGIDPATTVDVTPAYPESI